jgi:4-hydroxybenzoyl-CoA thioesterase
MYEREWTARFSDTDMFKIVYYPELFNVIHDTADAFLDDLNYPFWRIIDQFGVGLPIVEANAEFSRPIRAGDTVTVSLTHELSRASLRFDFAATHEDGREAFTAFEQRVCVPIEGDGSTAIPEGLREALEGSDSREGHT